MARREDLSDVAKLNCIYESGRDPLHRTIVVVVGSRLPTHSPKLLGTLPFLSSRTSSTHFSLLDRVFLYMIRLMDAIVDRGYVLLYVHTGMNDKEKPDWSWMKKVYNILDYKYSFISLFARAS